MLVTVYFIICPELTIKSDLHIQCTRALEAGANQTDRWHL